MSLGAHVTGKTHTLYYLANCCVRAHKRLLPIYVELPREAKGFYDLYRTTISQLPTDQLVDAHLEHLTRPVSKTVFARALDPDLNSALTQAAVGQSPMQVLLGQWLLGNPLATAALRDLGVGARINTAEKCAVVLADVISLLAPRASASESHLSRILWIIDEVQRVEDLSKPSQRSVLSGLVGVFNRCPTGLTILLSYTGTPKEKSLPDWIPRDLADRIGLEKPMLLPPLGHAEASRFVRDLMAHFRLPNCGHLGAYHPFEAEAIEDLLKTLGRDGNLKPRSIMEALDASLRELEPQIRGGDFHTVDIERLRKSLHRLPLKWSDHSAKKVKK